MRWSVGAKIGTGFTVAVVVLSLVGATSYYSTRKLIVTSLWVAHTHEVIERTDDVLAAFKDAESGQRGYIITGEPKYLELYEPAEERVRQQIHDLRELTKDNEHQKPRLDDIENLSREKFSVMKHTLALRKDKSDESFHAAQAVMLTDVSRVAMLKLRDRINELEAEERSLLEIREKAAQTRAEVTTNIILWGVPIAAILLALTGLLITLNISRPLARLTAAAEQIASGDLSAKISTDRRTDEVGVLARTFARMVQSLQAMATVAQRIANGDLKAVVTPQSERDVLGNAFSAMIDNLSRIMAELSQGAAVLSSASGEIVATTAELAAGSSQTATSVTETTTTVEEVRQTAQVASQKAKTVSETAQRIALISDTGKKTTDETAEGMSRIREHMTVIADSMIRLGEQTQAIGQIIITVDDLAQQSNLLAVNASIEAAKAGEQGKGFAVVAQEVKSLAEQSKAATTQVRTILADIQKATAGASMATEQGTRAVESGVRQSGQAGQSILLLAGGVNDAAQAAAQIAASSQQQLAGMDQVAIAMESIKLASSQNVQSARQLEGAARNLDQVGKRLQDLVGRYKLRNGQAA